MSQNIRSRDTSQRRNRTVRNDAPTRPLFSTASNQQFGSLPLIPCRGHKVSLTPKKGEWAAGETYLANRTAHTLVYCERRREELLPASILRCSQLDPRLAWAGGCARSEPALL